MTTPSSEQPSGPPLRALAMILIAAAALFFVLGLISLGHGHDSAHGAAAASAVAAAVTAPGTVTQSAGTPTAAADDSATAAAPNVAAPASDAALRSQVPVRVYNNSTVHGLATDIADRLRGAGWTVTEVRNYARGQLPRSMVYYGDTDAERRAAELIAGSLGVNAAPRFDGIADASPGVIVILTGDTTG